MESRLGIKRENYSERIDGTNENSCLTNGNLTNEISWVQEKQSLINEIVSLKTANQQHTLELRKNEEKLAASVLACQEVEINFNRNNENQSQKLNKLQSELDKINVLYAKLKTDNEKRILELTRDRDMLNAKTKQLETVISQQTNINESRIGENSTGSDDEEYEVECLLKDKLIEKRVYLVRSKNYDSSHDSWVEENDLNCPSILKKYKQTKRK